MGGGEGGGRAGGGAGEGGPQEERRNGAAGPSAGREGKDRPGRGGGRVTAVAGQAELDGVPQRAEVAQQLALVRLPTRGRLGIDAAVGRADPHGAFPRVATSST